MTTIKCAECGTDFERDSKELRRSVKLGRLSFCGRSCQAIHRNKEHSTGNIANLKADNRQDPFSSFRYYISKARSSERKERYGKHDLTVEYLKSLWESQGGRCAYTGILLDLPKNTQDYNIKGAPHKASLDRIDSTKGYVQGNVEFVCLSINFAKNGFSKEEMKEFLRKIRAAM